MESMFWELFKGLVLIVLGVGGKIFYDMLKYKAPPRDAPDIKKFPQEYDADLCAFKHNRIDKDMSFLETEDTKLSACVNHIKNKVHSIEVMTAEQQQQLIAGERRMGVLEGDLKEIKTDQAEIKRGVGELLAREYRK